MKILCIVILELIFFGMIMIMIMIMIIIMVMVMIMIIVVVVVVQTLDSFKKKTLD